MVHAYGEYDVLLQFKQKVPTYNGWNAITDFVKKKLQLIKKFIKQHNNILSSQGVQCNSENSKQKLIILNNVLIELNEFEKGKDGDDYKKITYIVAHLRYLIIKLMNSNNSSVIENHVSYNDLKELDNSIKEYNNNIALTVYSLNGVLSNIMNNMENINHNSEKYKYIIKPMLRITETELTHLYKR